jgi:hypothetical protein
MAKCVLAFCFAAALHALVLRLAAWMYRRRARRTLKRYVSDRRLYSVAVMLLACWYLYGSIREGRSLLNVVAVEAAFFVGVWMTMHSRELKDQLFFRIRGGV